MPKNFNVWPPTNPGAIIRLAVAVLVVANLVGLYFVIRPIGGSPQELRQQAAEMRSQIRQQQGSLDRTRILGGKIELGRGEGDKFMNKFFLPRRSANSTILTELNEMAAQAKVRDRISGNQHCARQAAREKHSQQQRPGNRVAITACRSAGRGRWSSRQHAHRLCLCGQPPRARSRHKKRRGICFPG